MKQIEGGDEYDEGGVCTLHILIQSTMILQASDVIMMIILQVQRQHWDPQVRLDFCSLARQEQSICRTGTSARRSKSTIALPFFAVLLLLGEGVKKLIFF